MSADQGKGHLGAGCEGEASAWVRRFLEDARGRTVVPCLADIACGGGRHIRLARERGWRVTAVDRDVSGARLCEALGEVEVISADLEAEGAFALAGRRFDCVVVTNYLWRPRLADVIGLVAEDGLLIYETFAVGQERLGRPRNPAFLLKPGELAEAVAGRLIPFAYEHVRTGAPERIVQRIAAVGPLHPWCCEPPRS